MDGDIKSFTSKLGSKDKEIKVLKEIIKKSSRALPDPAPAPIGL